MPLYLIEPRRKPGPAMVIRAACVVCCRSQAVKAAGPEGTAIWRDPEQSTVTEIGQAGKSGVVLRSEANQ